jgi:hypothetical protein
MCNAILISNKFFHLEPVNSTTAQEKTTSSKKPIWMASEDAVQFGSLRQGAEQIGHPDLLSTLSRHPEETSKQQSCITVQHDLKGKTPKHHRSNGTTPHFTCNLESEKHSKGPAWPGPASPIKSGSDP